MDCAQIVSSMRCRALGRGGVNLRLRRVIPCIQKVSLPLTVGMVRHPGLAIIRSTPGVYTRLFE
jgi:hypothetical protein